MERDRFLAGVADALRTADLPEPGAPPPLPTLDETDLVSLFRERAQAVNAVVHGPVSRHAVPLTVAAVASGHAAATFMAWEDMPAPGVVATLVGAGLTRVDAEVPRDEARPAHLASYRQVDLGVTGADAGLAESGSVALMHGPGRPRLASLVPDVHVSLLDVGAIRWSLAHWAEQEPSRLPDTANLVVVTGPSRSGDIELELNLGVHGPRHVHLVLID